MIHITAKPIANRINERVIAIAKELRELAGELPKDHVAGRRILLYASGLLADGVSTDPTS